MTRKYVYIQLADGSNASYSNVSKVTWYDDWVIILFPTGCARIAVAHIVGYEELDQPK